MENCAMYRLKTNDELGRILAQRDHIFVIGCNKCFGKFVAPAAPECDAFRTLAEDWGRTVTGIARLDFLCNQRSAVALEDLIPKETEHIVVISCGLGVQSVAELTGRSVFAACDSAKRAGHRGMALTEKACDACAQCYLHITGGICPVVDCAKGLLNGQCGGAQNGKCEADPNKDCAWEKIHRRLEAQGRLEELKNQSVQLRDYGKVNHKLISDYVKSIRESRLASYEGGVYPIENKQATECLAPMSFPEQDLLAINLAQHAGMPAIPVVAVGDSVKVGQKVGRAAAPISANIHSPISGRVVAIEERPHATRGGMALSVVIENDKKHTLHESVRPNKPLEELTSEEILRIVEEAGIVGMGGAGFPLHRKLRPGKPIDTVVLNGCECEPMLTADHQLMLRHGEKILFGLKAMMRVLNAPAGIIAVEDNKSDAIAHLEALCAGEPGIRVCPVKTKYPQGGERMLVKAVLDRHISGVMLPADVGCVVSNVATARAVHDAVVLGMPLIERITTVTGPRVKRPGNYIIKIGTGVRQLLDHCGVVGDAPYTVKVGGPMMGRLQENADVAATKCTNGIVVCDADPREPGECIKCGRCVDVCPMGLQPLQFAKFPGDLPKLKELKITDCMECRSCQYICAARIPLGDLIAQGKKAVKEMV